MRIGPHTLVNVHLKPTPIGGKTVLQGICTGYYGGGEGEGISLKRDGNRTTIIPGDSIGWVEQV